MTTGCGAGAVCEGTDRLPLGSVALGSVSLAGVRSTRDDTPVPFPLSDEFKFTDVVETECSADADDGVPVGSLRAATARLFESGCCAQANPTVGLYG